MATSNRSIAVVHQTLGLVATKPGVNIINGGGGNRPWEAKCCRTSLGTFETEEQAYEAYVAECCRRGMVPRSERAVRAGNPALARSDRSSERQMPSGKPRSASRAAWTPQEIQQLQDAVAAQLRNHGCTSAPTAPSYDWDAIAESLQTGRTGAAVYRKWVIESQNQSRAVTGRSPRSKRQRKHKVLPDGEVDIDYVDQDFFDAMVDASGIQATNVKDSQPASREVTTAKKQRVRMEGVQVSARHHVAWTTAEINQLIEMVNVDGTGAWAAKAAALGTQRTPRAVGQMYYALQAEEQAKERSEQNNETKVALQTGINESRTNPAATMQSTTSFTGIEYVVADKSWRLNTHAVPALAKRSNAMDNLQSAKLLRFNKDSAAARAYDSIVGQRVNFSLGDVVTAVSFEMVGQGVHVRWNAEEAYSGEILAVDLRTNKARIKYDDGQLAWESAKQEDYMDDEDDDAVVMRLLIPNTTVSLVADTLDEVEASSIDAEVIGQYLSFWFSTARLPKSVTANNEN